MNVTEYSAQNEFGRLKEVYIKNINDGFIDQDSIDEQWKDLNYLFRPDFEQALKEYEGFESILKSYAIDVNSFSKDGRTGMDSIYCRDASIVTDHGVVLCNMGKGARIREPQAQGDYFLNQGMNILGSIESPGLIEGGDTAWIDQHTIAVGKGYRSNAAGVSQLRDLLNPLGINVLAYDLPHVHGPEDVFHLMSIFSPIDSDLAVVYSPLMPVAFRQMLLRKGYQFIEVPKDEYETMGCNVLALAPRTCLMTNGNPQTESLLRNAGCEVITYEGSNISVAGGGGPTCLTRPISRSVE